jgi:hypothetical protein
LDYGSTMPKEALQARWVFALLAAQFIIPAISYIVDPQITNHTMDQVGQLLGGAPYASIEGRGYIWHMLAVGNVMTLGFMCALLAWDAKRWGPILPSLLFLKGFSALFSLAQGLTGGPRLFLGVFLLDGTTALVMAFFGFRAIKAWQKVATPG